MARLTVFFASLALCLAACGGSQGIRGSYPGPEPTWKEQGGKYCEYCGGGEELSVWARGDSTGGQVWLHIHVDGCMDGLEADVDRDSPAVGALLRYQRDDGSQDGHDAVTGSIEVHRCDNSKTAPFADVSFDLQLDDGSELSGRIATKLDYDRGAE